MHCHWMQEGVVDALPLDAGRVVEGRLDVLPLDAGRGEALEQYVFKQKVMH